jgi:hypothetical protein
MLDRSPIVSLALLQRKIIGLFVASFIQENTTVQNILFFYYNTFRENPLFIASFTQENSTTSLKNTPPFHDTFI